jgi:putative endonuclease
MNTPLYFVYVIRNTEGRLYIGFTSDLDKRIQTHQENKAGWTHGRGPWQLVYHEVYTSRSMAMRRERNLKRGKTNKELRQIIEHLNGRASPSQP